MLLLFVWEFTRGIFQGRTSGSKWESIQCLVVIEVEDVNDCAPRFLGIPYLAAVPRDAKPGEKALSVKAVDGDEGNNGAVRHVFHLLFFFILLKFDVLISKSDIDK